MLLRSASWKAKFDSGVQFQHWGKLSWVETYPATPHPKQKIEVKVRASDSIDFKVSGVDVPWLTVTLAPNCGATPNDWNCLANTSALRQGQYMQVQVTMRSNEKNVTPVLSQFSIQ
jgi:hypothetical protein